MRFTITFKTGESITKEFPMVYEFKELVQKAIELFEFEGKTEADFHDITAKADDTMFDNASDFENYMCEHDSDPLIELVMDMEDDPPNNEERKQLEERRKQIKECKDKIINLKVEQLIKKAKEIEKKLNKLIRDECSDAIPDICKNSANSFKDFMAKTKGFKELKDLNSKFKEELEKELKPVEDINNSFKEDQDSLRIFAKELDSSKFSALESSTKKLNSIIDSFNSLKMKEKKNCLFNINEENIEKSIRLAKKWLEKFNQKDPNPIPNPKPTPSPFHFQEKIQTLKDLLCGQIEDDETIARALEEANGDIDGALAILMLGDNY